MTFFMVSVLFLANDNDPHVKLRSLLVFFRCLSLSEAQHWLNEDRQDGDEEIYGNSCTWALLHLLNVWPKWASNSRSRSAEERPVVPAVLSNACGSNSCFFEGDIAGGLGLGLDTCHLLPEERQAMGHEDDKGKGHINNSKTETVLINSMEGQGRVWRHTLISAVHWRTHFSGWFVTTRRWLFGWETFCLTLLIYLGNKGSEKTGVPTFLISHS